MLKWDTKKQRKASAKFQPQSDRINEAHLKKLIKLKLPLMSTSNFKNWTGRGLFCLHAPKYKQKELNKLNNFVGMLREKEKDRKILH